MVAGVTATISSPIVGSGRLASTGNGTLIFANINSYRGGTDIEDRLLQLANGATVGAVARK